MNPFVNRVMLKQHFWSVWFGGVDGTRRKQTQYGFFNRAPELCVSSIGQRQGLTPLGFGIGNGGAPSGIEQHGGKSVGIRSSGWHFSYFREAAILARDHLWRGFPCLGRACRQLM